MNLGVSENCEHIRLQGHARPDHEKLFQLQFLHQLFQIKLARHRWEHLLTDVVLEAKVLTLD